MPERDKATVCSDLCFLSMVVPTVSDRREANRNLGKVASRGLPGGFCTVEGGVLSLPNYIGARARLDSIFSVNFGLFFPVFALPAADFRSGFWPRFPSSK